jgi:hypothetical protein
MTPITPIPIVTKKHSICQFMTGNDEACFLHALAAPRSRQSTPDQADLHRAQGLRWPVSAPSQSVIRHQASWPQPRR